MCSQQAKSSKTEVFFFLSRVPFVVSPLLSLVFGQVREDAIYRVSRGQRLRRCHKVLDVEGRKISSGE